MWGVKRCLVGYTGGIEEQPTYQNIGDYTEALFIEYDNDSTDLGTILRAWMSQASPYPQKCQYRTALWYLNEEQEYQMKSFVSNMAGGKYVDVEAATQFFMAEEYHQNFLAKQNAGIFY